MIGPWNSADARRADATARRCAFGAANVQPFPVWERWRSWARPGGVSMRAGLVFRTLCAALGDLGAKPGVVFGVRQYALGEAAGLSSAAVGKALAELERAGLLRCIEPRRGGRAARYELTSAGVSEKARGGPDDRPAA